MGAVRNGETSIQGFGRRANAGDAAPDGDTLFRIGSITKAFTGQLLASLAADGVVSLADPLTKYVPEFIAPLSESGRPIRLVDLATHSAGLPREVPHASGPVLSVPQRHARRLRHLAQGQSAPVHAGDLDPLFQLRLRFARRSALGRSAKALS